MWQRGEMHLFTRQSVLTEDIEFRAKPMEEVGSSILCGKFVQDLSKESAF
jgi:hypothetical protein